MQLFVKNNLIRNPYNREILHFKIWKDIFSLYHISCILFPQFDTSYSLSYEEKHNIKIAYQNICRRLYIQKKKNNSNKIQPQNIVIESPEISESNDSELNPTINSIFQNETDELSMTEQITTVSRNQIVNRLNSIQIKPIDNRIQELFMEIDQLGNYSQSSWFSNLSLNECVRFIRYLHQYWTIRGRIPNSTKQKICVLYDPFAQYNINLILSAGSIDDFKNYCVVIMELLIYCGENIEYRKLGALYVLSALTVVSIHARRAMPWLYEAL
jgi:hypothetical protein